MKLTTIMLIVLCWGFASHGFAQKKKSTIPKSFQKSVSLTAIHLTKDCRSEKDKVDSIYTWITNNIEYDYKALTSAKPLPFESALSVLKSKKAICNGYVLLMNEMLEAVGIQSEYVEGYTRGFEMDTNSVLFKSNHAWIAVKINGVWLLADPTWDAGYLGRIPKKEKTYPKRWLKEKPKKKHPERREKRIQKKKDRFDMREDKKDPYTNQFGFVFKPAKDYFLIDKDTFLLTHLPTLPQWQLKENSVSMTQYYVKDKDLKESLAAAKGENLDIATMNKDYTSKIIIDKWLYLADEGLKYNPDNVGGKAIHYHNYIGVLNDKAIKKLMEIKKLEYNRPSDETLITMCDTILIYSKLATQQERECFKLDKKLYGNKFKQEELADKAAAKEFKNLNTKLDKTLDLLDKSSDKCKDDRSNLAEKSVELQEKYRYLNEQFELPENELQLIAPMMKTVDSLKQILENYYATWAKLTDSTSLNNMYHSLSELDYQLRSNEFYLTMNTIETSENIKEADSLTKIELLRTQKIIFDSLQQEIPSVLPAATLRALEQAIKKFKPVLKEYESAKKIKNAAQIESNFFGVYFNLLEQQQQFVALGLSNNAFLKMNLKRYRNDLSVTEKRLKKVTDGKEKRKKQLLDELEKSSERDLRLLEEISEHAKDWKSKLKEKGKGKE